jgi:hypothetical protein
MVDEPLSVTLPAALVGERNATDRPVPRSWDKARAFMLVQRLP